MLHFFYSFEKLFLIFICIKFVRGQFWIVRISLTTETIAKVTFRSGWRIVKEALPWVWNRFWLFHSSLTALSLSDSDGNFSFEVSSTIILIFFVVEIIFFGTELRDSIFAIGSVILSFYFFNSLVGLWELNTFLHVAEIVASSSIGKNIVIWRAIFSWPVLVVLHDYCYFMMG